METTLERQFFPIESKSTNPKSAVTKVEYLEEFQLEWAVYDLIDINSIKPVIQSPIYTSPNRQNKWRYELTWTNVNDEIRSFDCPCLNLILEEFGDSESFSEDKIKLNCRSNVIFAKRDSSNNLIEMSKSFQVEGKFISPGSENKIEIARIQSADKRFLTSLQIESKVCCEPRISDIVTRNEDNKFITLKKKNEKLVGIIEGLLRLSMKDEIEIISNGRSFRINKALLSVHSPVFRRMFETEMSETKSSTCKIPDFEPEIVEIMVDYLMSLDIRLIKDANSEELFKIAHKYEMEDLKGECEEKLCQTISIKNALQMLILADVYNAHKLKSQTIAFINMNKEFFIFSNAFKQFMETHPHLIGELYISLIVIQ